jgi:hypothetical protein
MKKYILFLYFTGITINASAQTAKDLVISFGIGYSKITPTNTVLLPKDGVSFSFDFDYFIKPRHIISINYYHASNQYFYDYSTTIKGIEYKALENTVSDNKFDNVSILYKYKLINASKWSILVGTGLSLIGHSRRFLDLEFQPNIVYGVVSRHLYNQDLGFPMRIEANFWLNKRWALGLNGGIFYMPEIPIAFYVQPKLSFCIK